MSINVLQKVFRSKAAEILIALEETSLGVRELHKKVGGSLLTIVLRLRDLEDLGVIKREVETSFPFKHTITLTEKGRRLVPLLKEMLKILES